MIRKNIRLRKEYLFAKQQELQESKKQDNRIKMKHALDNDKRMPTEFKKNADEV